MMGLNPYALGAVAAVFIFYSLWLFQQGREFEQSAHARAVIRVNTKLKTVNDQETALSMKENELAAKARAEAQPVITASAPCIVTASEAQALSRIK